MTPDVVPFPPGPPPPGPPPRSSPQPASPLSADLAGFLLDAVSDLFFTVDADLRFTHCNDRVVDAARTGRVALLGRRLTDVFPELRGTDAERRLAGAVRSGAGVEFEFQHEAWDRWLAYRAFPVPGGLAVLARDVTEQKRAEAVLLESDERFRVALDAADLGTWAWSPGTDVIWCDDRAAAVLGVGPDDGPASADWLIRAAVHPADAAGVS
ncbi:MAG TPA: PAS domain-containing protein, partial [Humisphaera sp.]